MPLFYGVSEIFLRPRKPPYEISHVKVYLVYFSPPEPYCTREKKCTGLFSPDWRDGYGGVRWRTTTAGMAARAAALGCSRLRRSSEVQCGLAASWKSARHRHGVARGV